MCQYTVGSNERFFTTAIPNRQPALRKQWSGNRFAIQYIQMEVKARLQRKAKDYPRTLEYPKALESI
jgi:hypothetical protein